MIIPKGLQKIIPPPQILRVESFVEVRLVQSDGKTEILRTDAIEGVHPDWNEMLELEYVSKNRDAKFTLEELSGCTDTLYFILFDELKSISDSDMHRLNTYQLRLERRYLGSFILPLLTIFQNPPRIEAMFKVERPLSMFGYYTEKESLFAGTTAQTPGAQASKGLETNPDIPTYVTLAVSLNPLLTIPAENQADYYPGAEQPSLLIAANKFQKMYQKKYKTRIIETFGENIYGQSILACRYLTPQKPPSEVVDLDLGPNDEFAIEKVVRFVSMIPFIEDNLAFQDLPDMWCTSQEFLDLCCGDYEEHAILLCNYFNYIDQIQNKDKYTSCICIGKGVPEGRTVYVVRRDINTGHVELWNATKGEGYFFGHDKKQYKCLCLTLSSSDVLRTKVGDPTCQLKSVGCIITQDNVFVNVQGTDDPSIISFDTADKAKWKPFVTANNKNRLFHNGIIDSIQPPLIYSPTPADAHQDLEKTIENCIAKNFEKARSTFEAGRRPMRTKWNRHISQKIRYILLNLEMYIFKLRIGATNVSVIYIYIYIVYIEKFTREK